MQINTEKYLKLSERKDKHLHTKSHVLADDLSRMLGEPKKFVSYLGIAQRYRESDLRGLAKYVVEKKDLPEDARGRYFFGALKGLKKKAVVKKGLKKK